MNLMVIDPGHGGTDPGAVANGVMEKDLNLKVSLELKRLLEERAFSLLLTREDDSYKSLAERCELANKSKVWGFISIHCNASLDPNAQGMEVFYAPESERGKQMAQVLEAELKKLGRNSRGVKTANFYVLKHTRMPACLVEVGFITNSEEAEWLKAHPQEIAQALAEGISRAFLSNS